MRHTSILLRLTGNWVRSPVEVAFNSVSALVWLVVVVGPKSLEKIGPDELDVRDEVVWTVWARTTCRAPPEEVRACRISICFFWACFVPSGVRKFCVTIWKVKVKSVAVYFLNKFFKSCIFYFFFDWPWRWLEITRHDANEIELNWFVIFSLTNVLVSILILPSHMYYMVPWSTRIQAWARLYIATPALAAGTVFYCSY